MRVGIALGSNLGDRMANLRAARQAIVDLTSVKLPVLSSPIYETEPVDCELGAGKFLNTVLEIEYDGDPSALLEQLVRVEDSL
jgi:2-amino-4-hydroxy-6-hydroxymethyldihydropteridine diphosphokinase